MVHVLIAVVWTGAACLALCCAIGFAAGIAAEQYR